MSRIAQASEAITGPMVEKGKTDLLFYSYAHLLAEVEHHVFSAGGRPEGDIEVIVTVRQKWDTP